MTHNLLILVGVLCALWGAWEMTHPIPYNHPKCVAQREHKTPVDKNATIILDITITYYIRISSESTDGPLAFTTTYREMLRHNSDLVRKETEEVLRNLGVPEDEIQKAKEGK